MNKTKYIYYLILQLSALMFFSCSQEDMPGGDEEANDATIVFRVSLPDVETRSSVTASTDNLIKDGFYVSAFCPEDSANGALPYFEEQYAETLEDMPGYFGIFDQSSEQCVWPSIRHGKKGQLKFFAFYPSRKAMQRNVGDDTYFGLVNKSKKEGTKFTYDYGMTKFKVHADIARHIDFVTVVADGSRRTDGETGLNLAFEHQLTRVALNAWGETKSEIEIAGLRIGRAITVSDFNFAATPAHYDKGDNTTSGNWVGTQQKGCVEYIFREGDAVVKIDSVNHTSAATATSIMGNGGWAMLIPADNTGWDHTQNAEPARKQGLYFSVLLRVKEANDKRTLVYPYVAGGTLSGNVLTDSMTVVFLSVNKETGRVMKRVYRSKDDNRFYTDPDCSEVYDCPGTEEIRNYGWAAIPLTDYRWKPGYQYTYTLNYSNGVGVQDPADPFPGKPILSKVMVDVTEGTDPWPRVNNFDEGREVDVTKHIKVE